MLPGRMLFISIAQQADVGFSRRSTDVIQLALTLKMTTAQVVETSVTFNNNYVHPDDQTQPTFEMTPGFKPFTKSILFAYYIKELSIHVHCTWLAGSMNEWAGRWLRGERLVHYQRLPPTHTNLPRRLSLDENVHAKEVGKVRTLPMVPCGSSPVPRLYLRKTMRLRRKLERRNNLWNC